MTDKVLFVDDDPRVLSAFKRGLRKTFALETAEGAEVGLKVLKEKGPFAVVVSDQNMPGVDGVTFLKEVKKRSPLSTRMMLTGNADQGTASKAVNDGGIFRFLTKPCSQEDIAEAVKDAMRQYKLVTAERELLEATLAGSVKVLVDVLTAIDPDTFRETTRMRGWARAIGGEIEGVDAWQLDMATMLSPLGKALLPRDVVVKQTAGEPLTEAEREILQQAPETARNLISNIPRMEGVAEAIGYQNKNYDGSGFPGDDVGGEDIPVTARVLRILTELSGITSDKTPPKIAFEELEKFDGVFDRALLSRLRATFDKQRDEAEATGDLVKKISLAELQEGDELVEAVMTEEDALVLAAGNTLSEAIIQKIRQFHKAHKVREPIAVKRAYA
ncbi:MAG: HD domain-containing phosphohydrolase [Pseudomonadota bacterium]